MNSFAPWTRSPWTDAALLAEMVHPDKVPTDAVGKAPHDWYGELVATNRLMEAIEFLAHGLPRYECAVWTAHALLEMDAVDRLDPLMVAVLRWIDEPSDKHRRICGDLAEKVRKDGPASLLSHAIMYSGGSVLPEDLDPVLPPPDVCAKLAGAALLSGAFDRPDPQAALRNSLRLGENVAAGR